MQIPQRLECDQSYGSVRKFPFKGTLAWRKGKLRLGRVPVETGRLVAGISGAVKRVHVEMF